ncbi:hypothetical protein RyT2_23800 [Pseudolactococcus yaeyamensis]
MNKKGLKRTAEATFDEIINNWSVEATKEHEDYFYNVKEVNEIKEGAKSFVIGRKGCGKSAIAKNLVNSDGNGVFSEKLSFKNFPFNILYSLENVKEYTKPNQFVSIWKYLIYSVVCKQLIKNDNVESTVRKKLEKIYYDSSVSQEQLSKMLDRWTNKNFSFQLGGFGFGRERELQESQISWLEAIDILENIILEHGGNEKYFIVFDELDEDYRNFETKKEEEDYKSMLTSLFKAVQDIRSIFDVKNQKIYPVVFLRSDIYSRIKHSDKNKWREDLISLRWDGESIKRMLAHRLCIASHQKNLDFDTVFYQLFSKEKVNMGNMQQKEMEIFNYIERSTEMRPRDFIQYVIECGKLVKKENKRQITPKMVKKADEEFSEYLKSETIDELYPLIDDVDEILGLLSIVRKQTFKFAEFAEAYRDYKKDDPKDQEISDILLKFFEAGVIGNQPSMRGQAVFSFSKNNPRFNYRENMRVHRGLYKALQIY